MQNIEVELRSFITDKEYDTLLAHFRKHAIFMQEDEQETHYLDTPIDLRIQRNTTGAKIWMKKGKIHDEARAETEVHFVKEDFDKIKEIFKAMGIRTKIKWFRKRFAFNDNGITVTIDDTKGYGKIIEFEIICGEPEKNEALQKLKKKFTELNITLTPREEFETRFKEYEKHWSTLTNDS